MHPRFVAKPILVLLIALGLLPLTVLSVRARAARPARDERADQALEQGQGLVLEQAVARQLARLDERLGLRTFPDGTGQWTARLAASLEYRLHDPEASAAFAPNLLARLADDLRRLGVERDLDPPPARPGVAAKPEPPERERVARLQDLLDILRRLDAKLDRLDGVGDRTAQIAPRVAPANDDCSAAAVVGVETVSGSTSGASVDGDATCGTSSSSPDVWYRFTAPETSTYGFDTFGSSYDTVLSLQDGCPVDGRAMEFACNDDAMATDQSQVFLSMTAGEEVWIRVSGFGGLSGAFDLTVGPEQGIEGTITREDTAAAVAGATVRLYDEYGYFLDSTVSGADGSYRFIGLSDGTYYIKVTADGLITELYDGVSCPSYAYCYPDYNGTPIAVTGGVTSGIDLALDPAGAIEGEVTATATGDPLDSYVTVYSSAGFSLDSTYSGSDGSYSFADLPTGKYYLKASVSGYRTELYDNIPCPSDCVVTTGNQVPIVGGAHVSGIDFALDRLGAISGAVTEDGTGDPVVGARVEIYDDSGYYRASYYSDSTGSYLAQNLAPGTYFAVTDTDTHKDELYDDIPFDSGCTVISGDPIAVSLASTTTGIDFSLIAYGKITGRVTEAVTGIPLVGGSVYLFDSSGYSVGITYPAADGTYELPDPPGVHFVGTGINYEQRDETWENVPCEPGPCDRTLGTPIEVPISTTLDGIDFTLDRWGIVEATVTGADTGYGLYGALQILDASGAVVRSDYDGGSFSVDRLPAGTYYAKFLFDQLNPSDGYEDELYDNVPCDPTCDLTQGTPFTVMLNGKVSGLSFVLARCPANTTSHVVQTTFLGTDAEQACDTLTVDDGTTVASSGDVTFEAGRSVVLGDGFKVDSGGKLRIVIEPSWTSDQ